MNKYLPEMLFSLVLYVLVRFVLFNGADLTWYQVATLIGLVATVSTLLFTMIGED